MKDKTTTNPRNAGRKRQDPAGARVRIVHKLRYKHAKFFADNPEVKRSHVIDQALDAWIKRFYPETFNFYEFITTREQSELSPKPGQTFMAGDTKGGIVTYIIWEGGKLMGYGSAPCEKMKILEIEK